MSATLADVKPIFSDHEEAKAAFAQLMQQPHVDRAALEEMRVQALQKADLASRRMTQSFADVPDVLTQEQKAKLLEMRQQMRRH